MKADSHNIKEVYVLYGFLTTYILGKVITCSIAGFHEMFISWFSQSGIVLDNHQKSHINFI